MRSLREIGIQIVGLIFAASLGYAVASAGISEDVVNAQPNTAADKSAIETADAPKAIGPYSQAVVATGFIFASGQIGLDPKTGKLVGGGVTEQTEQVLKNLEAVLNAAGSNLDNVVKTTVFLADINDFAKMNEVYARRFNAPYPARSTVQVARLPLDARVEIEAIAVKRK